MRAKCVHEMSESLPAMETTNFAIIRLFQICVERDATIVITKYFASLFTENSSRASQHNISNETEIESVVGVPKC